MSEQPMVSLATYVEVVGSLEARIADLQRDCDTYFGDAAAAHVRLEEVERELERFKHLWSVARTRADTAERALDAERERADTAVAIVTRNGGWDTAFDDLLARKKAEADLATERQARQQAEGERDVAVTNWNDQNSYVDDLEHAQDKLEARLADAEGLLRRTKPFLWPIDLVRDVRAFLDRVDASAEEPAAGGGGR